MISILLEEPRWLNLTEACQEWEDLIEVGVVQRSYGDSPRVVAYTCSHRQLVASPEKQRQVNVGAIGH